MAGIALAPQVPAWGSLKFLHEPSITVVKYKNNLST